MLSPASIIKYHSGAGSIMKGGKRRYNKVEDMSFVPSLYSHKKGTHTLTKKSCRLEIDNECILFNA